MTQAWAGFCRSCNRNVWVNATAQCQDCGAAVSQGDMYLATQEVPQGRIAVDQPADVRERNPRLLIYIGIAWVIFWYAVSWYWFFAAGNTLIDVSLAALVGSVVDTIGNLKTWPGIVMVFFGLRAARRKSV